MTTESGKGPDGPIQILPFMTGWLALIVIGVCIAAYVCREDTHRAVDQDYRLQKKKGEAAQERAPIIEKHIERTTFASAARRKAKLKVIMMKKLRGEPLTEHEIREEIYEEQQDGYAAY